MLAVNELVTMNRRNKLKELALVKIFSSHLIDGDEEAVVFNRIAAIQTINDSLGTGTTEVGSQLHHQESREGCQSSLAGSARLYGHRSSLERLQRLLESAQAVSHGGQLAGDGLKLGLERLHGVESLRLLKDTSHDRQRSMGLVPVVELVAAAMDRLMRL